MPSNWRFLRSPPRPQQLTTTAVFVCRSIRWSGLNPTATRYRPCSERATIPGFVIRFTTRVVWLSRSRTNRKNGACPGTRPLPGARLDESDSNAASARRRTSRRAEAVAVGLDAAGAEIDPRGRARAQVPHEDVAHAVGVARNEVRGRRRERDQGPAPGYRDVARFGGGVTDHAAARDVQPDRVAGAADALAAIGPTAVRSTATHPAARRMRIWRPPRS